MVSWPALPSSRQKPSSSCEVELRERAVLAAELGGDQVAEEVVAGVRLAVLDELHEVGVDLGLGLLRAGRDLEPALAVHAGVGEVADPIAVFRRNA